MMKKKKVFVVKTMYEKINYMYLTLVIKKYLLQPSTQHNVENSIHTSSEAIIFDKNLMVNFNFILIYFILQFFMFPG